MDPEEFLRKVEIAIQNDDLESLKALMAQFLEGGSQDFPFQPNLRLQGQNPDDQSEGAVAMAAANGWARAYRLVQYRLRIRGGYSGPIIVSEGDSWFQYPIILDDIIDNLAKPFAVYSLGAAGDTLENMLSAGEYRTAIAKQNADFFLFSASGNDVLGNGNLGTLLHRFQPGMELNDLLKHDVVEAALSRIEDGFEKIIRDALSLRSSLHVFFHGYDRPIPRRGGKWLGQPMEALGIPNALQASIAGALIDKLHTRLTGLESKFPKRAHHIDCRGRVGGALSSWYDELHPRNPGFERVAALFEAHIGNVDKLSAPVALRALSFEMEEEPTTSVDLQLAAIEQDAAEEAIIDGSQPMLIGGARGNHLSRVDLEILDVYQELQREFHELDKDKRLRARRHMVPDEDSQAFERILGESNLFPVNFLSRGASKAAAVAKIQLFMRGEIPVGSGSGFLVGSGLLLTNNHVLPTRDAARRARAIFNYQDNDAFLPMQIHTFEITDDIFFTSDRTDLDFTFVSVSVDNDAGDELSSFGHFTLVEESGKAVKGEPVSIIQHPRGNRKSIALRDSKIIGVKGDFIYYSTDTEPGSSGSPVLNDQWLPVALHHRSVPHPEIPNKWIANRGIRISQIFRMLRAAARHNDSDAVNILRLIGGEPTEEPDTLTAPKAPLRRREDRFVPSLNTDLPDGEIGFTEETFRPDRWDGVDGYDPNFLSQQIDLPLPVSGQGILEINQRPDLPYKHFSVVMHAKRRLAILTACNVDGADLKSLRRSGSWRVDPRIPRAAQVDNAAYRNNDYDRGHLIRRLAPMWGSHDDARMAMVDTFHYTVCAPQHARLNQGIWLELEDYLLDWARRNGAALSIFTGPVFRADDPIYRDIVQVPSDYWKIAVAETRAGLRAVGYLHTQKNLISTVDEAFGDYQTHRLPIHVLGDLTGLDVGVFESLDVAGGGFESTAMPREVRGLEDIGFQ